VRGRFVGTLAVTAIVLLLVGPVGALGTAGTGPTGGTPRVSTVPDNGTAIPYNSSVDGFPLSYEEWLPAGYVPTRVHYPLLVYLHGQQDTSGRWVQGGLTSSFVQYLNSTGHAPDIVAAKAILANASLNRFILIAPNSRTGAGFYVNSLCGGPQEQDLLDAIAHEESLRHTNLHQVYLVGSSMGSTGVLTVAGHHPGMFRGIASIAAGPDMFEGLAWRQYEATQPGGAGWANNSIHGVANLECGVLPSPAANATVISLFTYLSVVRYVPQTLAKVLVYVTGGGQDRRVPNNGSIWNYLQVNNTWVNSSCVVAAGDGEPANCTTTFATLHARHPGAYLFRYVYEPDAPHGLGQLEAADMFSFWRGTAATGDYLSTYPPSAITPAP
jgi:pimeloyl-ACP methyl ester carboxylesterase